ncbi:hypothetical protein Pla52o_07580 [Novipirellula galeiformis]|uniref:N-acetyltransferase domain-containing protein n=1 Tax=Novipirellula galeiformis TaxID=2528004 RepID=A0A5C6CR28_9BACT|nr:hypothetical protein [Novipirellula galeiformis]TWU26902.1 hypothetical protein Pla52o_07580 [Novipirellula galeiformis]
MRSSGVGLAGQYRFLFEDVTLGLTIARDFGTENRVHEQVMQVRREGGGEQEYFDFDSYSFHYSLLYEGQPVGAMTATRPVDGAIDCSDVYAPQLMTRYHDCLVSTCKFRINRSGCSSLKTLRTMVREFWRDQVSVGSRLNLINADKKMVAFYQRMGYCVVEGSDFIHPTLGTDSVVMMMSADPTRKSFCTDIFSNLDDVLSMDEVITTCSESLLVDL